jgi:tRNA pseudouridine38-40 synthase
MQTDNMIQKIALCVQYNGKRYHGWQYQSEAVITVQGELEKALSRVANETIKLICAGRTDAGVHASAQIVHFETSAKRQLRAWTEGVNTLLPEDISVQWAGAVHNDFHARFSAVSRRYRYFIANSKQRPAIASDHLTWHRHPLDEKAMHEAAQSLLGENDFQAYRAAGCQSQSSFRNITDIAVWRQGSFVIIDVEANAFLLHMVRNIVGVLLEIGDGTKAVSWAGEVLLGKDRKHAGITASPKGLILVKVSYPSVYQIPELPVPLFCAEV